MLVRCLSDFGPAWFRSLSVSPAFVHFFSSAFSHGFVPMCLKVSHLQL